VAVSRGVPPILVAPVPRAWWRLRTRPTRAGGGLSRSGARRQGPQPRQRQRPRRAVAASAAGNSRRGDGRRQRAPWSGAGSRRRRSTGSPDACPTEIQDGLLRSTGSSALDV